MCHQSEEVPRKIRSQSVQHGRFVLARRRASAARSRLALGRSRPSEGAAPCAAGGRIGIALGSAECFLRCTKPHLSTRCKDWDDRLSLPCITWVYRFYAAVAHNRASIGARSILRNLLSPSGVILRNTGATGSNTVSNSLCTAYKTLYADCIRPNF